MRAPSWDSTQALSQAWMLKPATAVPLATAWGSESIGGLEAPLRSLVGTLELTCGSAPRPGGSPHPTGQLRGASGKHRRKRGSVGAQGLGHTHTYIHTHIPSQKNHGGGVS